MVILSHSVRRKQDLAFPGHWSQEMIRTSQLRCPDWVGWTDSFASRVGQDTPHLSIVPESSVLDAG